MFRDVDIIPSTLRKPRVESSATQKPKPEMVLHTGNLSSRKDEAGRSKVQGQHWLRSKFRASLDYRRHLADLASFPNPEIKYIGTIKPICLLLPMAAFGHRQKPTACKA